MARLFDTSALLKRYHTERGSTEVDAICSEPGSRFLISWLAIVECVSAFCLKARSGEIDFSEMSLMRKSLMGDVRRRTFSVSRLFVRHLKVAESLLLRHGPTRPLRAPDAIHLALALELFRENKVDLFVSSDTIQCEIARLEGLPMINPLAPIPY
jgi:hypothetical protein